MNQLLALGSAELKLLLRNRSAAVTATAMPLAIGLYFVLQGPETFGGVGWTVTMTLLVLLMLGFTVYQTATTALTARRQELYLKRLRSGEVADSTILSGMLLPVAALGVVQVAVLLALAMFAGAPLPVNPAPLVFAVLGGALLCLVAGAVTSGLTGTTEGAQLTTTPFFAALFAGALWVALTAPGKVHELMLAVPGGAIAELVRASFGESTMLLPAAGALLVWILGGAVLALRVFRWEPRL